MKASLRTKILGLAIGILLLMRGVEFFYINKIMLPDLEREFLTRASSVVSNLSLAITNPFLTDDRGTITHISNEVRSVHDDIEYIFLTDENGNVIAHTFKDGFPVDLLKVEGLKEDMWKELPEEIRYVKLIAKDKHIYHLSRKVYKKGNLHIGFSKKYLETISGEIMFIFVIMSVFMVALVTLVSLLLGTYLTNPIKKLLSATNAVKDGHLDRRVSIKTGDEFEILAVNFNNMVESLKRSREELERTWEHLIQSEKFVAIGTLSAGIAHEIYNPLNGISNCLKILSNKNLDEKKRKEYFNIVFEALDKISSTVRGLLDYSRRSDDKKEKVNMADLINSTMVFIKPVLNGKEISFKNFISQGEGWININKEKIQQVITNLLLNAAHAIEDKKDGRIEITLHSDSKGFYIKIVDNGCGIPSNIKHRIFDPFFTTKPPGRGTGLGLPVSRSIVESYGGSIDINSIEGKGTEVTVYLPFM